MALLEHLNAYYLFYFYPWWEETYPSTSAILFIYLNLILSNRIIGVVQMVNKLNGQFVQQDEESFEMFAVYCGLALHQAKVQYFDILTHKNNLINKSSKT